MKNQPMEWKKIYANYVSDKGIISKRHKELIQFNSQKNSPTEKWIKNLNRYFYKGDIQTQ